MTFVDTNVLLDIVNDDAAWFDWSSARLNEEAARGPLVINYVVYAEVSVTFPRIEDTDAFVRGTGLRLERTPRPALFLAARAYVLYRRRGGTSRGVQPDFFIGAHAAVRGVPLLTRDPRRYRRYFPTLRVIAPEPLPPPGSGPH